MLQRFALAPTANQLAKYVHLGGTKSALEVQIQLHARKLEQVRQKQLGLQPGRVHALFGQKFCAPLNNFQDRHPGTLYRSQRNPNAKQISKLRLWDLELEIWDFLSSFLLVVVSVASYYHRMKQISLLLITLSLCASPSARSQDAATEERL